LEFFKKVNILFSKNPQRKQKQRNISKIKEILLQIAFNTPSRIVSQFLKLVGGAYPLYY